MRGLGATIVLLATLAAVTVAKSGHEVPVYPSFYPHEIDIESMAPERAAPLLQDGKIQAFVGNEPRFAGAVPEALGEIRSLGAFLIVRVNPASRLAQDETSACAVARTVLRDLATRSGDFIFHPYPVTPWHGDYLHYADLAEGTKARLLAAPGEASHSEPAGLKVKAEGASAARLVRPDWRTEGTSWDASLEEVDAAHLVASASVAINGWFGPPWLRAGWFQAALLLADGGARAQPGVEADLKRLEAFADGDPVEKINIERRVVETLAANCRKVVAGYTVKREYVNVDYSAGIENIGYDALDGLQSPMFLRTAKLKDFPWNGWLVLGIGDAPAAAWNPIAGFSDRFGRMMWFGLSDPAALPAPYDAGWMLNRIADVKSNAGQ
jgi:hypothetical protein